MRVRVKFREAPFHPRLPVLDFGDWFQGEADHKVAPARVCVIRHLLTRNDYGEPQRRLDFRKELLVEPVRNSLVADGILKSINDDQNRLPKRAEVLAQQMSLVGTCAREIW